MSCSHELLQLGVEETGDHNPIEDEQSSEPAIHQAIAHLRKRIELTAKDPRDVLVGVRGGYIWILTKMRILLSCQFMI